MDVTILGSINEKQLESVCRNLLDNHRWTQLQVMEVQKKYLNTLVKSYDNKINYELSKKYQETINSPFVLNKRYIYLWQIEQREEDLYKAIKECEEDFKNGKDQIKNMVWIINFRKELSQLDHVRIGDYH